MIFAFLSLVILLASTNPASCGEGGNHFKYRPGFFHLNSQTDLPWFLPNGTLFPSRNPPEKLFIWPEDIPSDQWNLRESDRYINQLMYMPSNYDPKRSEFKTISVIGHESDILQPKLQQEQLLIDRCPVNRCLIHMNWDENADAVLFHSHLYPGRKFPGQIMVLFSLESPAHDRFRKIPEHGVNWTVTYRRDSDIFYPYEPYIQYSSYNGSNKKAFLDLSTPEKSDQVVWMVSNCYPGERKKYAEELSKHIQVDIFGRCSDNGRCQDKPDESCIDKLSKKYRYYLAFENSNCRDYITEKLLINGLHLGALPGMIPIVFGAPKADVERYAPENSFIHVDDFRSPKHLAKYLKYLNNSPDEYNRYFQWRNKGEFIQKFLYCQLCALLHDENKPTKSYKNVEKWWTNDPMGRGSSCTNK